MNISTALTVIVLEMLEDCDLENYRILADASSDPNDVEKIRFHIKRHNLGVQPELVDKALRIYARVVVENYKEFASTCEYFILPRGINAATRAYRELQKQ